MKLKLISGTKSCRGISVIENLVALTLLAIVLAGNSRLIITTMHSNHASRNYSAISAEVQEIIDGFRNSPYTNLLGKFSSSYGSINDGQVATETITASNARADFQITYTAQRGSNTAFPEAVRVKISALERRAKFGNISYDFETVIAQVGS